MDDSSLPAGTTGGDTSFEVIRHEEQLVVTTERRPRERVRLQRVIVTGQRTITVDVRREEIRVTREPLTGDALPEGSPAHDEEPLVIVLHEEQVVLTTTIVPVERITVTTPNVTHDVLLTGTVKREDI